MMDLLKSNPIYNITSKWDKHNTQIIQILITAELISLQFPGCVLKAHNVKNNSVVNVCKLTFRALFTYSSQQSKFFSKKSCIPKF